MTIVLGIESSCDDTAAAVVERGSDGRRSIRSNIVWTETAAHEAYGGVVPEIAARSHVEKIDVVIGQAMSAAGLSYDALDAIAATAGPGLLGGVMVGLTAAKAIALAHGKPLIPLNHLEGHALSVRMTEDAPFPYLLLLVSGGHTQLLWVEALGRYRRLGTTIDDAAGEAFDKTAKLLGLPQPGGPNLERAALTGRYDRFDFPEPLARRAGCDFSLSGLKTAVRIAAESLNRASPKDVADLAASFQHALARHLAARTQRAMALCADEAKDGRRLVVAGGVAANRTVRQALEHAAHSEGWSLIVPPAQYCTDNGAMIAWAGLERFEAGLAPTSEAALAYAPRPRWPLGTAPEGAAFGGGKKGPKA